MKLLFVTFIAAGVSQAACVATRTHDVQHDVYTWRGDECDGGCQALGGEICGRYLKDCCKVRCEEGTFYDSCKDKKEYTKSQIDCTIKKERTYSDRIKDKIKNLIFE